VPAGGLLGWRLDRRRAFGAAAGAVAALAVGGRRAAADGGGIVPTAATRAGAWVEAERIGVRSAQAVDGAAPEPVVFAADFPFLAVAPSWGGEVGPGAWVDVSLSPDQVTWSDPVSVGEAADAGRRDRGDRRFGHLVFHPGATFVRYQAYDPAGEPTTLPGLGFDYLDAAAGPSLVQAAQEAPLPPPPEPTGAAVLPPPVIPRAAWGADEGYRFSARGEIWPATYAPIEHVIVHHSETANFEDPLVAIRSIYYFHAVTRGWGDIGYNFLIDFLGNIYEGRAGGSDVVGGHARLYNDGSSGIGLIGNYQARAITPEMRASLQWLTAYLARNLDPFGAAPFYDIPNLPTICGHRDVNPTACPGDFLYEELPALRDEVSTIFATGQVPTRPTPAFAAGQAVETAVDGAALRDRPSLDARVIVPMRLGEPLTVSAGPATVDTLEWFAVRGRDLGGWVSADLLTATDAAQATTPVPDAAPDSASPPADQPAADPQTAAAPSPPPAQPALPIGGAALVAGAALNLHQSPGLAAPVVGSLGDGSVVTVLAGPTPVDGYDWYQVDPGGGEPTGWVAGGYLAPL